MARAPEEWAKLIEEAKCGDSRAISQLMAELQPLMYCLARRVLQNNEDVKDVVQEAMLKVWRYLPTYDSSMSTSAWFGTITIRTARDLGRKLKVRKTDPLPDEGAYLADTSLQPDLVAEKRDVGERLMSLLDQLPDSLREPLVLHYIKGMSHGEAAAMMGITPAAFNSRLNRARDILRQRASEEGLGPDGA